MSESVITVGESRQLVGVHTASEIGSEANADLMVLMVNSGILSRIGPLRLHVTLARRLAACGLSTYRFDLSGIGDSDRVVVREERNDQHHDDISEVMDYFEQKRSVKRFIIMGICAGAHNAHVMMVKDHRVVGAVCIDGYTYPTLRYSLNYYLQRLFNPEILTSFLKKIALQLVRHDVEDNSEAEAERLRYRWSQASKEEARIDYQGFIERQNKMLCIYTSDWPYNYEKQLADAFRSLDFGNFIQARYLEGSTHTYLFVEDRERLIKTVLDWCKAEFSDVST